MIPNILEKSHVAFYYARFIDTKGLRKPFGENRLKKSKIRVIESIPLLQSDAKL